MVSAYLGLLALVGLERAFELALSRRNAARAFARGGIEAGAGHFGVMRAMHTAFLVCCAVEVLVLHPSFQPAVAWPMLGVVIAAQALRYWAISVLGDRWNVRVIVVPGEPAIRRGPYRFLRHPNYVAVCLELMALPLVYGAWHTALAFSAANTILLTVRIRCEERALRQHCAYAERFGLEAS